MMLIKEIYDALKNSTIQFDDEYNLICILSENNTDQSAFEIEKDIVRLLSSLTERIEFISEKEHNCCCFREGIAPYVPHESNANIELTLMDTYFHL